MTGQAKFTQNNSVRRLPKQSANIAEYMPDDYDYTYEDENECLFVDDSVLYIDNGCIPQVQSVDEGLSQSIESEVEDSSETKDISISPAKNSNSPCQTGGNTN